MIEQLGIVATGVVAVWLTQDPRDTWRRWACLFGLAGQPFWIWAAAKSGQWGILAISLLYTWAWARGVWKFWVAPGDSAGAEPAARRVNVASGRLAERESLATTKESSP